MGLEIKASDVRKLLDDPNLKTDIANAVLEDPAAMNDLAEDIADELDDELEDDPELKRQIIETAMASPEFKKKVMREVIDDLG